MKKMVNKATHIMATFLSAALFLTGCTAVGPNYSEPQIELRENWNSSYSATTAGDEDRLASWWHELNDPVLASLIDQAVANNLDIKEAVSRVRQARYERNITSAARYPSIDGNGAASSSGNSENESNERLYSAGVDASWEIDIFGGVQRSVEASVAEYQAQVEDLHDVLVTLLSEVAINYIDLRTYQQQYLSTQNNIRIQQQNKDLTDSMLAAGLSDELEQAQAAYQLAGTKAQLPSLETSINSTLNRLAVLLGESAGSLDEILSSPEEIPVPEKSLAAGIPANVVRQRPDIRQAERRLAAQTALIGVAKADLYPHLYLSGSLGLQATTSSAFFSDPTSLWSIGPSISWSLFNAGSVKNNVKAKEEVQQQYLLQYQTTVIEAIEEIENSLNAFDAEQKKLIILTEAVSEASRAVDLATQQFSTGLGDFKDVLDAQQALLTYEDSLNESKGNLATNLVELYKALGGGWQDYTPESGNNQMSNKG